MEVALSSLSKFEASGAQSLRTIFPEEEGEGIREKEEAKTNRTVTVISGCPLVVSGHVGFLRKSQELSRGKGVDLCVPH